MTARAFLVVLLASAVAGCESPAPAPAAAPPPKAAEKKQAETAAAPAEESALLDYSYTPIGKRDPFRSLLEDVAERTQDVGHVDCGPLCKWELEQFKLVAVISGISNPLAMVEAPGGKGYVVRRGTFMGKRNGKVVQIRAGEIVIAEYFKDQKGQPHLNQHVIKVPADKNAQPVDEANLLGPEAAE